MNDSYHQELELGAVKFVNREQEMQRLDDLLARSEAGLAVIYGRRRVGKTRLLLEWTARHDGLYAIAEQTTPQLQREIFAEAFSRRLPHFADVKYPDWHRFFERLAYDAKNVGFRGPIVIDELPYLALSAKEVPSVLQRWIDHTAKEAGLVVALAGSSQRMMHGAVLSGSAPLFGRAHEIMKLQPIEVSYLPAILPDASSRQLLDFQAAWGGIPRYWELAHRLKTDVREQIYRLVIDPLGPLHDEPDRLLSEEIPSATELRPILDAIGLGANRLSEIAARMGRSSNSITRPLLRLQDLGLVVREIPFGESEKKSKRGLYKISDTFFRMWFNLVAPHRAQIATGTEDSRLQLLDRAWPRLASQAWEDLCRHRLPRVDTVEGGPWGPASRWWRGNAPEWDLVSESLDGERLMLGEVKWTETQPTKRDIERWAAALERREPPILPKKYAKMEPVRCLFVPELPKSEADVDVRLVSADQLIAARES